jgi:CheY-like chemotaxis protein
MDVQMPVMDGLAATRALRAEERELGLQRTPVLAVTANAMAHHQESYTAAGLDGLVSKPVERDRLLTAIALAAARRPERSARERTKAALARAG